MVNIGALLPLPALARAFFGRGAAPPKGAYHSWVGTSEAVAEVTEQLLGEQLPHTAQMQGMNS